MKYKYFLIFICNIFTGASRTVIMHGSLDCGYGNWSILNLNTFGGTIDTETNFSVDSMLSAQYKAPIIKKSGLYLFLLKDYFFTEQCTFAVSGKVSLQALNAGSSIYA